MKYTKESPYGYWISKDDIIPVIGEESHAEVAYKLLKREPTRTSIYAVMWRLGYMRVVNYSNESGNYGVEYWRRAKLSKLQKEFVKDAEHVDTVDYRHLGRSFLTMM
jgi:hypothetical protein